MDWLRALDLLLKAKDFKDQAEDLKKLYDYADKINKTDPKDLTWDDLKYFENEQTKAATADLRATDAALTALLGSALEPPESGSLRAFDAAMKAAAKYGHDSKEAKSAVETYRKVLVDYDKTLKALLATMERQKAEFPTRIAAAKALAEYAKLLAKAFIGCAKIPSLGGTAQNAMFFTLSQDCAQLAGLAATVGTKMGKAQSEHNIKIGEMKDLISQNQDWIDWAAKDALKKEDTLKKNAKTETPRK